MKVIAGIVLLFLVAATALQETIGLEKLQNLQSMELEFPYFPSFKSRPPSGDSRIVGGVEATPHQFPYQAGVFVYTEEGVGFCGGSLIADQWTLTAAHCAEPGIQFTVVLGAHEIFEDEDTQVRIDLTEKYIHPNWSRPNNDVALLKFPSKVEYNAYIQPIRLPSYSQGEETFADLTATISGWGVTSDGSTMVNDVLMYVQNPVIKNIVCNAFYFGIINEGHICVSGVYKKSSCNGDSGGPVVITESDGVVTLIGAVSFGISLGCEVRWPSVHARVGDYLQWIGTTTGITIRP